jgi:hypothetical protein
MYCQCGDLYKNRTIRKNFSVDYKLEDEQTMVD